MSLSQVEQNVATFIPQPEKHQKENLPTQNPINNKTNISQPSPMTTTTTLSNKPNQLTSSQHQSTQQQHPAAQNSKTTSSFNSQQQHHLHHTKSSTDFWSVSRTNSNRTQPNDCHSAILTYQQVRRLHMLMEQRVPIHGRGNFPALQVRLRDLICRVSHKLRAKHINIRDIRLNGGAASYVLAPEKAHYNDLDLIFATDLNDESKYDVIRDAVLDCLRELHIEQHLDTSVTTETQQPQQQQFVIVRDGDKNQSEIKSTTTAANTTSCQMPQLNDCAIKEAYVHKMVKVNDEDRWSLISLGVHQSEAYSQQQQYQSQPMNHYISFQHQQLQQKLASTFQATSGHYQQSHDMNNTCNNNHINIINHNITDGCDDESTRTDSSELVDKYLVSTGCPAGCNPLSQGSQQQQTYKHNHQQPQLQRQFPNSIELKFVDRMRRKFEFSVDSFQIILDSLMDFYHFAPQSSTCLITNPNQTPADIYISQLRSTTLTTNNSTSTKTNQPDNPNKTHNDEIISSAQKSGKLNKKCYYKPGSPTQQNTQLDRQDHWPKISSTISKNDKKDNSEELSARPYGPIHRTTNNRNTDVVEVEPNQKTFVHELNDPNKVDENCINAYHHGVATSIDTKCIAKHASTGPGCNRSESSSSGCSSSSSVVSSSSSSLSFEDDEPDEEFELVDVDGFSDASSSNLSSSAKFNVLASLTSETDISKNDLKKKNKKQTNQCYSICSDNNKITGKNCHVDENCGQHVNAGEVTITGNDEAGKVFVDLDEKYAYNYATHSQVIDEDVLNRGLNLDFVRGESTSSPMQVDEITNASVEEKQEGNQDVGLMLEEGKEQVPNEHNYQATMSSPVISENFYPTVVGRSEYGNFNEALSHLEKKLIATRNPEQIRGGGLLKYCNLLVKSYKPTNLYQIRKLERYMCSRFFIDFCDLNQQQAKLESYLANHFSNDPILKFDYLTILHNVVQRSTVCLMNHELRVTLNMIRDLAYKLNDNQLIGTEQYSSYDHQTAMIMHQQQLQQQHQRQQHQHQQHQAMEIYNNNRIAQETQKHPQHQNQSTNPQHDSSHKHHQHNQKMLFINNKKRVNNGASVHPSVELNSTANSLLNANTIAPGQQQTTVNYYEHQRPPVILHSGVYRVKMVIA